MTIDIKQHQPKKISFLSVLFVLTALVLILASGFTLFRSTTQPATNPRSRGYLVTQLATPPIPSSPEIPVALNMGMSGAPTVHFTNLASAIDGQI